MRQRVSGKVPGRVVLLGLVCTLLSVPAVHAGQAKYPPQQSDQSRKYDKQQEQRSLTATQAAARAQAQYGGKVLKVSPSGKGYKVKLLTDSGRVLTVTIQD
jgi:uncharacterized membrane protein YkoI